MNNFMGKDDPMNNLSSFDITNLIKGYDKWEQWFKEIGDNIGNESVEDTAKRNGEKIPWHGEIFFFTNWGEKGSIEGIKETLILMKLFYKVTYLIF